MLEVAVMYLCVRGISYVPKNRGRRGRMVVGFKLPMQSVFITTNVVSWDHAHARCARYNIM